MRTYILQGFFPRILRRERDLPIFAQHGKEDISKNDLIRVNLHDYYPKTFRNEKPVLMELEVAEQIDSGFTTINLALYYLSAVLEGDNLIKVKNCIADEMFSDRQYEITHERTMRRNNVFSLDADDGTVEIASSIKSDDPVTLIEFMEMRCCLCCLLNSLPEKQGERVAMHFVDGMSRKEIARKVGVCESSVNESIDRGLRTMRENFYKIFSNLPCQKRLFCPD